MPRFEAIIFDKDGTLFDFNATWSVWARSAVAALGRGNNGRAKLVSDAIGFDLKKGVFLPDSPVIAGTVEDIEEALKPHIDDENIVGKLDQIACETVQVPVDGLSDVLAQLAHEYVLGVVTNDSEEPALIHLSSAGIAHHFKFIAGYDSGFGAKPEPGQLFAFCDEVGIAPEKTVMVGDSRHDLSAARKAGMKSVAVLTGVAKTEDLTDLADAILPNIGHLQKWLDAQ
ncbi:MAG: HAD-IA family hydrolase [Boseongicola sp.]|nr:MAG: HAD-IA family hydrolase [Boseongicola sp.]